MFNSNILKFSSITISCFALIFLAACSSNSAKPKKDIAAVLSELELKQGESPERIRNFRVNGWQDVDNLNLIVFTGVKDQYLISLRSPCPELRSAFAIGLTSRAGYIDKFEYVVVSDRFSGNRRCAISDIVKLEKLEEYPEGKPPESEEPKEA